MAPSLPIFPALIAFLCLFGTTPRLFASPPVFPISTNRTTRAIAGESFYLDLTVSNLSNSPPTALRWHYNGFPYDGFTYIFNNAPHIFFPQVFSPGDYYLVASNEFGSATSSIVHLELMYPPGVHSTASLESTYPHSVSAVVVDSAGNLVIAGSFSTNLFIDHRMLSGTGLDLFIAKLTPDFRFLWARSLGTAVRKPIHLRVDDGDQIYLAGEFSSAFGASAAAPREAFLAAFAPEGTSLWHRTFPIQGSVTALALRSSDLYLAGSFTDSVTIGNTTLSNAANSFIAQYNTVGDLLRALQLPAANPSTNLSDLLPLADGSMILAGEFRTARFPNALARLDVGGAFSAFRTSEPSAIRLAATAANSFYVLGRGGFDFNEGLSTYVSRYATNGTALWSNTPGSSISSVPAIPNLRPGAMAARPNGNIVIAGNTASATASILNLTVPRGGTPMLLEYEPSGRLAWAMDLATNCTDPHSLAIHPDGSIYVAGTFDSRGRSRGLLFKVAPIPPRLAAEERAPYISRAQRQIALAPRVLGTGPLEFQWKRNGMVIQGATNHLFTATASDETSGLYELIIDGPLGTTTNTAYNVLSYSAWWDSAALYFRLYGPGNLPFSIVSTLNISTTFDGSFSRPWSPIHTNLTTGGATVVTFPIEKYLPSRYFDIRTIQISLISRTDSCSLLFPPLPTFPPLPDFPESSMTR